MSEVETKGRHTLAGMFGGEKVVFGKNVEQTFDIEDPSKIEAEIKDLPEDIVLYFHSISSHFPDYVTDLISELHESIGEREARRRLRERFGLPRSPLAVPVFAELSNDLVDSQEDVAERAEATQTFINTIERLVLMISLYFASRLNAVEDEEQEYERAIIELNALETQGNTMRETTAKSVDAFEERRDNLVIEKRETRIAQAKWLKYAEDWERKLSALRLFETPIDLGALDPSMAL